MTYVIETINAAARLKIQNDLNRQSEYAEISVHNFLWNHPDQTWAIDRGRDRYLHPIAQLGPSTRSSFHFFLEGKSYTFTIPDSPFNPICPIIFITCIASDNPENKEKLATAIQDAFDTYGRFGHGPDESFDSKINKSPGASRVVITLPAKGI